MKKFRFILLAALLVWGVAGYAQRTGVREEVRADWNKCSGLDCLYDCTPKAMTPPPKGYAATYISHYGRHGSRYAYTAKAYTVLLNLLRDGASQGNLTSYGFDMLKSLEAFWEANEHRVGDLTPIGWDQHQYIASTMVSSFPKAFGKGSTVDACSSPATRSIVSMSSFCSAISRKAPKTTVYAHQSTMDVQATRPNMGPNPFRYKGPSLAFPYGESEKDFFLRKMPGYKDVLARLFKNPDTALKGRDPFTVFFNFYMFIAGMNSIPEEERIDVKGLVSVEEYATLWEIDNYQRFIEYFKYRTSCCSIIDDIIAKADARLASGSHGADLRFGHDHVVMALLLITDIDDFAYAPPSPDDLVMWFHTFRSPMAANIQFVFYTSKKGEPLVKVLLNGEEAHLGKLPADNWPYYKWSDVKDYLNKRTAMFVNR